MVCLIAVCEGVLADDALGVMGITKAVRVIAAVKNQLLIPIQDAVMFAPQGIRINAICPG